MFAIDVFAVQAAVTSVGLPTPVPAPPDTPIPPMSLCAFVPVMFETRCVFVVVGSNDVEQLCELAYLDLEDGADLLAETANVLAGMIVGGTEYSIGLPIITGVRPLNAPPPTETVYMIGEAKLVVGTWG